MRLVYRPEHPKANSNGLVDRAELEYERTDAIYVIRDEMEPTRHMADNKMYTSKHKFREATRAAGCVEYGSETATLLKPRKRVELSREKRRDDIRRAFWEVRNGVKPERD